MSLDQYTQNIILSGEEFEIAKKYWIEKLQGEIVMSSFPPCSTDAGAGRERANDKSAIELELSSQIFAKLLSMSRNSEFGMFMIIVTTFKYLLYRYTGNEDIIVGMPVFATKTGAEFINNVILLRSMVDENTTFKDLLMEVRKTITEADEYANYPYSKLAEILELELYENKIPYIKTIILSEQIQDIKELKNVQYDTLFSFSNNENSLIMRLEYNTCLYEKGMMERIAAHFTNVLNTVTQNPNIRLAEIEILSAEDKQQLVYECNNTQAEYPREKTIHQLFCEQAARTPEHTAVVFGEQKLTYRELNEKSDRLAGRLKEYGVKPDTIIGIMVERSLEMIVGMFAVLKSGGAYLPIDPDYPPERIQYMVEDSGAGILLTLKNLTDRLGGKANDIKLIDLKDACGIVDAGGINDADSGANQENINKSSDLAYIIYTSGTTGKSKGAMIEHRNVVRLMFNDKMQFDFNDKDVWTMFHSFCFDFSVWEIYGALLYGGQLVIVPKQTAQDPAAYLNLLKKQRVTVLNQTPTAFYSLIGEELQSPDTNLALRYVIFGGEALKPLMLQEWRQKYPKVKLVNMYGITETTVHVTYKEITEKEIASGISNIGKPIPTLTTYIMDKKLRLLPIGAVGELCVGGDGVGRGYLNRPELTAARFVENPCKPGERLYRSGDLAKRLPDGDMEYYGRSDHQVKIRGHRIELGEIENTLLKHEVIKEAVVIAREDKDNHKYLCAYVVPSIPVETLHATSVQAASVREINSQINPTDLRAYLATLLPEYMIPSYFIALEKIPMTVNNKVDRKALPEPKDIYSGEEYVAPENETEERLAAIWQEALEVEKVGVNANFFNLGGDSIKAISLISKMNRTLGASIAIKDIYMYQTIRELAAYLGESGTGELKQDLSNGLAAIEDIKRSILKETSQGACKLPEGYEDFYPLSPIQQGMVFFSKLRPEEPIYHDQFPYLLNIKGFEINVLNEALRLLALEHPILRTTFIAEDFREPLQVVHSIDSGIFRPALMEDLAGMDEKAREKAVYAYMESDLKHKFKFANDLLWRMRVFKLGNNDYCIILSFQHAVLDGWSVALLMGGLFKIFAKLVKGERYEVKELKTSYKDYVALNMSRKSSEKVRQYWKDAFQGYNRNKLPFNISNKRINNLTGIKILRKEYDIKLLRALEEKAVEYHSTVKDICLAAHVYLLGVVTTENDIVTGVVTHDRPATEDSEAVLGCYLNTIPIRVKTGNEVKKTEILDAVKVALRNAKANELFLADIAGIIGERGVTGNPIFDTLHNYTDFHILESVEESDIIGKPESGLVFGSNEMTNTLLDLEISKTFNVLILQIKYAPYYFHDENIRTMADLYTTILEKFAFDNSEYLRNEALLTEEQFKGIVYEFNNTQTRYTKEKTMHQLFEEQAARTPDNIALVTPSMMPVEDNARANGLTYRELNEKANQLARILIEKGVKSGDHIALLAQRGVEMIIGMFAILKSGGAYVPIDPEYPLARQKYIADNSKVTAVLADQKYEIEHENTIIIDYAAMDAYPATNPGIKKDSQDLAYVIYTSGSTGIPKGVMIEHHSAVNLISWVNKEFEVNGNDALLFITSMCFDLSVYDIFGTLAAGGRVVIARREWVQNPDTLKQLLVKNRITFWDSVPSTMNYLVNALDDNNDAYTQEDLRLVFMSGDWIPVKLPDRLKKYFPKARPISLGGATEGTVWSNFYPITEVDEYQTSIPYGRPIANNYFYILDKDLRVVPKGVAGELYIGGVGVARGYMNDEERTKASFMKNRFQDAPDEMMYKTGDLGRMLPDGNMEFLGRIDHQVKIRGYRVELGEIENKLLKHPSVKEAVVVDRVDSGGNKYLCAYIVPVSPALEINAGEIRAYLATELPDYMIPAYFVGIAAVPLTSNGKIDRKALPEPETNWNTGVEYVAPGNEIERKLAEIWEEILEVKNIGVNDNFFEVGGNSLLLIRMHSQINKIYPDKITVTDIFMMPTIVKIAEYIGEQETSGTVDPSIFKFVAFPQEYFNEDNYSEAISFDFKIQDKSCAKLKQAAERESASVGDILLSLYLYLLAEITEQDMITLQAMLDEKNLAAAMDFDVSKVESISELIRLVNLKHSVGSESERYNIKDTESLILKKHNNEVVPLIYQRDLYSLNSNLLELYDLAMSFDIEDNRINFKFEYNKRFKQEWMEKFVNGYLKLIGLLTDKE